jgi:hypothetical protein
MKPPPRLYKYQPFDVNSIKNLIEHQIWFSKPLEFNDPFDCNIRLDRRQLSDEEFTGFCQAYDLPTMGIPIGQLKEKITEILQTLLEKAAQQHINERGISCFSEKNDDLLLWSHYANKHTGFCLGFDTSFDPFPAARRVNYLPDFPSFDPLQVFIQRNEEAALESLDKMFLTKAPCWVYEGEWRIFNSQTERQRPYKRECLTAVYFGLKMNQDDKFEIMDILKSFPTIRYYEMFKSDAKFQLVSKQIYVVS